MHMRKITLQLKKNNVKLKNDNVELKKDLLMTKEKEHTLHDKAVLKLTGYQAKKNNEEAFTFTTHVHNTLHSSSWLQHDLQVYANGYDDGAGTHVHL